MEKENTEEIKKNLRWFTSHEEIKTREDLKDLMSSLYVKENLGKMLNKIEEMSNLANSIQKDIEEFEKGGEIDKEKLGKEIDRLRFMKHELRQIKFGKFQQILTGKVDDYAKRAKNIFPK